MSSVLLIVQRNKRVPMSAYNDGIVTGHSPTMWSLFKVNLIFVKLNLRVTHVKGKGYIPCVSIESRDIWLKMNRPWWGISIETGKVRPRYRTTQVSTKGLSGKMNNLINQKKTFQEKSKNKSRPSKNNKHSSEITS